LKSYQEIGKPDSIWYHVSVEKLRGKRWLVEFNDGDPMGGSRNTVLVMTDEDFRRRFVRRR
jgi:hypothetical protein